MFLSSLVAQSLFFAILLNRDVPSRDVSFGPQWRCTDSGLYIGAVHKREDDTAGCGTPPKVIDNCMKEIFALHDDDIPAYVQERWTSHNVNEKKKTYVCFT